MLEKIIAIKNVGRFLNSAAAPNPQLSRHTFIHGANARGKSTLCAILRSLHTGECDPVIGRKTLGSVAPSSVVILADGQRVSFDGTRWSRLLPELCIFDNAFVVENVFAGEAVDVEHRRGLYRVIIGRQGVQLAEEEARLAVESRRLTGEITAAARAIQTHIPGALTLEQFVGLARVDQAQEKIAELESRLAASLQVEAIQARPALTEVSVPNAPRELATLLARTIEDVSADAESILRDHLAAHAMEKNGQRWLAEGLGYRPGNTCPFCNQNTEGLDLLKVYKRIFSQSYEALRDELRAYRDQIVRNFGEPAAARATLVD